MQRKATKNTRGPNADEKAYVGWVKEQTNCFACDESAMLIAHHCEGATFKNQKVLVGHWFVIGLCKLCDDIVTRRSRKIFRKVFGPQSDIWWREGQQLYVRKTGKEPPFEVTSAICDWGR